MPRTKYDDAVKAEALRLYATEGIAAAEQATGVPRGTLKSWASRAGVEGCNQNPAAAAAVRATMAERRERLAEALMGDVERLRVQLFAPCVEQKPIALSGGRGHPGRVEIAVVERDQPTFGEQVKIMTAIGIAVDKVQLLTGEATQRTETLGGDPRREALEAWDELEAWRERRRGA
ncbi:MAG TPA: hypothetical protein VGB14_16420 [Acidimicrobiales bacterium]|jgi:transposase-like protein